MSALILAVDCESSGLPDKDMALDDPKYPWPTQIAAELFHADHRERLTPPQFFSAPILASGRQIDAGAEAVHGVSSRQAERLGWTEITALGCLIAMAKQASAVVAYSAEFDKRLVQSALVRLGKSAALWTRPRLRFIDLKEVSTPICRLAWPDKDDGSHRWPTLDEACSILLKQPPRGDVHEAYGDMTRARSLFHEIRSRGLIEEDFA